jgi:pimeloyl-ACP methyl ester carboxylesterase
MCEIGERGQLVDYEQVASYLTAQSVREYFDEWIAFYQDYYLFPDVPVRFEYGFDSYKVSYCTVDAVLPDQSTAQPTIATGMVSVPRRPGPLKTVVYLHGTSVSFYDAVSNPNIFGEFSEAGESFDGPPSNAVFAGSGFLYIAPDYLGLGDSDVPRHRYFHAATEASAAADLLAASQGVLEDLQTERDEVLFTFGFSQGGHAALALHRELQEMRFDVTATATVGAVLDVEQFFLVSLGDDAAATLPLYVTYILLAYDDVYDIYDDTSEIFQPPFESSVEDLFDMQHYFDDIVAGLPTSSRELLARAFLADVTTDPDHPLRVHLRDNAVDRWTPDAPIRMYYSPDDEEVLYGSALASVERLREGGATITVEELPGLDHVNSWVQAMPLAAAWFESLN